MRFLTFCDGLASTAFNLNVRIARHMHTLKKKLKEEELYHFLHNLHTDPFGTKREFNLSRGRVGEVR